MASKHANGEQKELRIVLIGTAEAGKTSIMETIKGNYPVKRDFEMVFVDTPDLSDPDKSDKDVLKKIAESIFQGDSGAGPHVFLYVYNWEARFEEDDEDQMKLVKEFFGNESERYFVPLITCKDKTKLEENYETLKKYIDSYFGVEPKEYCLTQDGNKAEEVQKLVNKINEVVKNNRNSECYTKEMFKKTQDVHKEVQDSKDKEQAGDGNQILNKISDSFLGICGVSKETSSELNELRKSLSQFAAERTMKAQE